MTKFRIKEDIPEETIILDDGTKKLIEYGTAEYIPLSGSKATIFDLDGKIIKERLTREEASRFADEMDDETIKNIGKVIWGDPNQIPENAIFSNFWSRGKLTAEHMKVTLFDKDGNKIKEEIKINEYQDEERYDFLFNKHLKENPSFP